jgi:hypothetical protein
MSKLRASARNMPCMVRIPGYCNFDESTTVLAHLNGGGMGIKRSDLHGAFACSSCHDVLDRRVDSDYDYEHLKLWHFEGMVRTQEYWLKEGLIKL